MLEKKIFDEFEAFRGLDWKEDANWFHKSRLSTLIEKNFYFSFLEKRENSVGA